MSRILILAPSGFGKTTSWCSFPEVGIIGVPPEDSYLISATSKPLPSRVSNKIFTPTMDIDKMKDSKRLITNNALVISNAIEKLHSSPYKVVGVDDFNYIMQDYYMDNAMSKGWDAPKIIGFNINKIFKSMEKYESPEKHIVVMAHGEEVATKDGRIYVKMKTTGKMVDEYITPEGKFDITLIGKSYYDTNLKKVVKQFVTNEDETYSSPKSPIGMFSDLYIPNDLGYVINKVNEYYL